jgi:hypothetical protein
MCMKVKQFGANMCKQVVIVLRFFLDCFKLLKTHNMVTLMLDPHFKDLSSVGDYIDHSFAVEIVARHMIVNSSSQPSRPCTKSCMNNQMFLQMLYNKLCTILMLFLEWECLRMQLVLNKCCFFYLFERHANQIIFLFAHFKLTYLGILCVCASLMRITMLSYIWCAIGRNKKPSFLVVKTWREIMIIVYLIKKIICILNSQIGMKKVFSIARILTSLHQCQLGPNSSWIF